MPLHLWVQLLQALAWSAMLMSVAVALRCELQRRIMPICWLALAMACALLLRAAVSRWGLEGNGVPLAQAQVWSFVHLETGVGPGALGATMAVVVLWPLQSLGWAGRNELRLMIALGSLLGPRPTAQLLVLIMSFGVLLALFRLIWQWHMNWVLTRGVLSLARMLPGSIQTFEPAVRSASGPFCGAKTIAAALLTQVIWQLYVPPGTLG